MTNTIGGRGRPPHGGNVMSQDNFISEPARQVPVIDEVDVVVASLVSLMEPLLVVFLGVICGFIVIALFMPMVSMIEGLS